MEEHKHHGGGFFNGFILGLLVGAGLVFLFGTNKGKRVLQMLLEQVEENTQLSELLEMPDSEEEEYMEGLEEEPSSAEGYGRAEEPEEEVHKESKPHKTVAKVKRFFKGAPKKLVS